MSDGAPAALHERFEVLGGSNQEETPRSDRVVAIGASAGMRRSAQVLDMIETPRFSMIASSTTANSVVDSGRQSLYISVGMEAA